MESFCWGRTQGLIFGIHSLIVWHILKISSPEYIKFPVRVPSLKLEV